MDSPPPPVPPAASNQTPQQSPGSNPFAWFAHSLSNYANFSGRARRREWWSFWFINCIPYVIFAIFAAPLETRPESQLTAPQSFLLLAGFAVVTIYWVATFVPFLSVTARRFHDIGLSAWWMLLILTPLLGGIFMTVCCLIPGQKAANEYGEPIRL